MLASGLRDPLAPEVFPVYFEQLYWRVNSLDEKDILKLLQADGNLALQFRTAASQFRLIDEAGQTPVFVQYGEGTDLIERLRKEGPSRDLLRRLQRFTVNVRSSIVDALLASGSLTEIWQGFVVQSNPAIYHGSLGFLEEPCTVEDPRNLVV
jgi:CRISPR-associated endonuclease/helicase Cas3